MLIRLALESDKEVLATYGAAHAQESTRYAWSQERAEATFKRYLDTANPTIFVAEERRQVIGYVVGLLVDHAYTYGTTAFLDVIYVRPDKRGTRAAALLVEAFKHWAQGMKVDEIRVEAPEEYVSPSIVTFFRRRGFRPAGQVLRLVEAVYESAEG